MAIERGSQTNLWFAEEATPGTFEDTATFDPFARTGGTGFTLERGEIPDETLTPNSQEADTVSGNNTISGAADAIMRPDKYDVFLAQILKTSFAGTVASSAVTDLEFLVAGTIENLPNSPAAGDVYKISGSSNPGNNGIFLVDSVATAVATVRGNKIVTQADAESITVTKLSVASKGSDDSKSYSFVQELASIPAYLKTVGAIASSWSISSAAEESYATSSFAWSALSQEVVSSDPISGRKSVVLGTSRNGFVHYDGVFTFNNGANVSSLQSMELTIETPLSAIPIYGDRDPLAILDGITTIAGTMNFLFRDTNELDLFLNDQRAFCSLNLKEIGQSANDGKGELVLILPRTGFGSPTIDTPAEGAVTVSFPYKSTIGGSDTKSIYIAVGT